MRYFGGKMAEKSVAWSVHSDSRRRSAGARIVSCYVGEDVLLASYWLEYEGISFVEITNVLIG